MGGFCKLSSELVKSSIWSESLATRVVWLSLLSLKDQNGFVAGSRVSMNRICNVTLDEFDEAIKVLESPDPNSRNKDNEGRRLKAVEGGWIILNHFKYREYTYSDNPEAVRMRKTRNKSESVENIMFNEFWKLYPKKLSKSYAIRCWDKQKIDEVTFEKIKKALEWQVQQPNWIKEGGQYIPNASTYINQKRWEDEQIANTNNQSRMSF